MKSFEINIKLNLDLNYLGPAGKTKSTPADSGSTLNEHNYKMKSGKYWVRKQGKVLFEYCRMDDAGVPPSMCI